MNRNPKSTFEQLLPMILQTLIGVVILLIAWIVILALPMLDSIQLPLDFTIAELITALILTVIIAVLISFGIRLELRLAYLGTSFPQAGAMIKQLTYLAGILIAYYAFKPVLVPYLGDIEWIYSLVFLLAFVLALFMLGYNIYSNMEAVITLFSGSTAAARFLICTGCGEKNIKSAVYCCSCGKELIEPAAAGCGKCGAALKTDAVFCAGCGKAVDEAGSNLQEDQDKSRCPSCAAQLKPGAHFCGACGSTVESAESELEDAAEEQAAAQPGGDEPGEAAIPAQTPLCSSCGKELVEGARFCPSCGGACG